MVVEGEKRPRAVAAGADSMPCARKTLKRASTARATRTTVPGWAGSISSGGGGGGVLGGGLRGGWEPGRLVVLEGILFFLVDFCNLGRSARKRWVDPAIDVCVRIRGFWKDVYVL